MPRKGVVRPALLEVPYSEISALDRYIDDQTPFSTKHGVKGQEFENVLVVCGRGWNMYDFGKYLEWRVTGVPKDKDGTNERYRNLFYVACSRPKTRLAILFTELLSAQAISSAEQLFGNGAIRAL